jgi:hypothetical protein
MPAALATADDEAFNPAERAFLSGVFAYQRVTGHPTEEEFRTALIVMTAYRQRGSGQPARGSLRGRLSALDLSSLGRGAADGCRFCVHALWRNKAICLAMVLSSRGTVRASHRPLKRQLAL